VNTSWDKPSAVAKIELKRAARADPSRRVEAPKRRGRPAGKFVQHKRMSELRQLLHQHPKGVTLAEIAAHLQVTTRSARRYLSELRYDLEAIPERPGGQKRWRIPAIDLPRRVQIRRTQAYALLACRALFTPMTGSTLYEEIDLAHQALLGVARRPGRGPNAGLGDAELERRFRYLPFAPQRYRAELVDVVFQAVAELRALKCRRHDGARLRLHPYALLLYKDALYCLALDTDGGRVLALGLDAIADARVVDEERFSLPDGFDVEHYVQGQFGLCCAEGPTTRVVVELDSSVADYALSRTVHPSQHIERLADGNVRLCFDIADLTEVTTWVIGFGSRAKVIEPPALKSAVREELTRAVARYD
jgi:predicted DNA-binding transcriptional regulator YafY